MLVLLLVLMLVVLVILVLEVLVFEVLVLAVLVLVVLVDWRNLLTLLNTSVLAFWTCNSIRLFW